MLKRTKKGLLRPDAGVATINLVTLIPAFIVITWMAAEVGMALRLVGIARDAAESVALAAAARYRDGFDAATLDGTTAALGYTAGGRPLVVDFGTRMNGGTDVAFGRWDPATRAFSVDSDGGPAVRVRVRFGDDHPNGSVGLLLPGLFGTGPFSFERTAVAVYVPPRHTTSLRIEGTGADTLRLGDSARLVSHGGVSVLSGSARAVNIGIGPEVEASVLRLGGSLPEVEFGAHLHSTPDSCIEKMEAALHAGCKRFDGAIKGLGGCECDGSGIHPEHIRLILIER